MKTNKNKLKKMILVGLVLAVCALGFGYLGYRAYKSARQVHQLNQAKKYLGQSQLRKATLSLMGLLKSNPRNVEACRLMADICEATGSPEAPLWRSRVVEYNPGSLTDRLALVHTSMAFGDLASATNALEAVNAAGRKTSAYQNVAGEVASMVGQTAQAEAYFQEAVRLEPTNAVAQFNLSVVRLRSTNSAVATQARATLTQLSTSSPILRCQALRELVMDALRNRQTNAAVARVKELVQQTNSAFSDQLLRLSVLKATQNPGFNNALAASRLDAGTNTLKIKDLTLWQMAQTGPAEALIWLRSLPKSTQTNQTVEVLAADCLNSLGDWRGLQNTLTNQNWGNYDFVRHALLTRALREQGFAGAATGEWQAALQTAEGRKEALIMLLRFTATWKWQEEEEKLLANLVNGYPSERWAAEALTRIYYAGGRTRPLLQLFIMESKRAPNELYLKNNLANTALLLDEGQLNPHDLARQVYQAAPTNAGYATTYAFSLYLQKKIPDALKVLQSLKPQDLEQSSVAGYYGLILQAAGSPAKAGPYLDLALKGSLLPEERKLFEKARAGSG